jgi:DNA-binding GntR family transcriptional regulator
LVDEIQSEVRRIERSSLSDSVVSVIRDQILTGRLTAGERVLQTEWANQLGVSRMPVRDAIRRLVAEGLLVASNSGSATVAKINPSDLRDAYELTAKTLSLAARWAAERATEQELHELQEVHAQLKEAIAAGEAALAQRLNVQFHRVVAQMAHSPQLRAVLRLLSSSVSPSSFDLVEDWPRHALHDHECILRAILKRDADAASKIMLEHITTGYTPMVARLEETHAPE